MKDLNIVKSEALEIVYSKAEGQPRYVPMDMESSFKYVGVKYEIISEVLSDLVREGYLKNKTSDGIAITVKGVELIQGGGYILKIQQEKNSRITSNLREEEEGELRKLTIQKLENDLNSFQKSTELKLMYNQNAFFKETVKKNKAYYVVSAVAIAISLISLVLNVYLAMSR